METYVYKVKWKFSCVSLALCRNKSNPSPNEYTKKLIFNFPLTYVV